MNIRALIYKDLLLLVRDVWGIVLLFFMPWALVLLMAYLQDGTFRSINENRISLYLLNADGDSLGRRVSRQLSASRIFDVSTEADGRSLTVHEVEEAVMRGDYLIGVIIPEGTTERLREQVRHGVERAFDGEPSAVSDTTQSSLTVGVLVDPAAKPSFRSSVMSAVREEMLTIRHRLLLQEISAQASLLLLIPVDLNIETDEWFTVDEAYARSEHGRIIPNATQHNVPAWSMFAVFFIVVSLAGNMIRERETGCLNRLMTMPCSYAVYLFSKMFVYLCVCLLQLTLMMATGMYLIPLLGLPALKLGHSAGALLLMSVSASLSAIGYGLAIGSIARTNQQASIFGAVSVVMLAALGGVWIPTFVMPHFMRLASRISPLNWGLNGFNELFVRDAGMAGILPYASLSLLFFVVMLGGAVYGRTSRRRKN